MDVDRVSRLFWKDILGDFTNKIEIVTAKNNINKTTAESEANLKLEQKLQFSIS